MYLTKTPDILKPLAKDLVWDLPSLGKEVFLTFDDGPIPEVTPLILDILSQYGAKATFFCVGENIDRHPGLFEQVKAAGHAIGNHCYSHEKGWETGQYAYLKSYLKTKVLTQSTLFRPPHGQIKRQQVRALKKDCHIVMWDVLSGDFDTQKSPEQCVEKVLRHVKPGSIVVFHDSIKASSRVLSCLPAILESLLSQGYSFPIISLD